MTTYFCIANLGTPCIKMDHLEFGKGGWGAWTSFLTQDRICEEASICKCSNEPSGSITCREFFGYL